MSDFLLVFRRNGQSGGAQPSPEQLQTIMTKWQNWIGGIAAKNKLVDRGNRLSEDGKIMKPGNLVTDGPYVEFKESVGGYTIIRADSLGEATELSKDCPILLVGGNVEIREIVPM